MINVFRLPLGSENSSFNWFAFVDCTGITIGFDCGVVGGYVISIPVLVRKITYTCIDGLTTSAPGIVNLTFDPEIVAGSSLNAVAPEFL